MDDWDNESTEVLTFKKFIPEYLACFFYTTVIVGLLLYSNEKSSLTSVIAAIGSWIGCNFLNMGLFGRLLKRISLKGLVYRGEKADSISTIYLVIGAFALSASFLILALG